MQRLILLALTLAGMPLFGMEMEITLPVTQDITFITKDKQSFIISPEVANFIPPIRGIAQMNQFTQKSKFVDGKTFQLILQVLEQFVHADTTKKLLSLDPKFFETYTFTDIPALTRNALALILKVKSAADVNEFKKTAYFLGIEGFADAATAIQNKAPQVYSIADLVALEQVPEITQGKLDLSQKNLVSAVGIALIPEIKTVTQLILDSNQLQSLPDTIGNLQNLTTLTLEHNPLSNATKQFLNQLQQQHPDLKIYMDENKDKTHEKVINISPHTRRHVSLWHEAKT